MTNYKNGATKVHFKWQIITIEQPKHILNDILKQWSNLSTFWMSNYNNGAAKIHFKWQIITMEQPKYILNDKL